MALAIRLDWNERPQVNEGWDCFKLVERLAAILILTPRLIGAPPALFNRVRDFEDSEASVMLHADYGARPYWASRVHAISVGMWKIEESYFTTVWAAPRLTAIPGQSA